MMRRKLPVRSLSAPKISPASDRLSRKDLRVLKWLASRQGHIDLAPSAPQIHLAMDNERRVAFKLSLEQFQRLKQLSFIEECDGGYVISQSGRIELLKVSRSKKPSPRRPARKPMKKPHYGFRAWAVETMIKGKLEDKELAVCAWTFLKDIDRAPENHRRSMDWDFMPKAAFSPYQVRLREKNNAVECERRVAGVKKHLGQEAFERLYALIVENVGFRQIASLTGVSSNDVQNAFRQDLKRICVLYEKEIEHFFQIAPFKTKRP